MVYYLIVVLLSMKSEMAETEGLLEAERRRYNELEGAFQHSQLEQDSQLQNERQTISLLVSEKTSLATELQRLEGLEASTHYPRHIITFLEFTYFA